MATYVPQDIVFETLIRLPVKSILRFRLVSKLWDSIISSNQFTKSQLINCSRLHQRLMLYYSSKVEHCPLVSMFTNQPIFEEIDTNYLFDSSTKSVRLMGSCDGLICIALGEKDLILWNPSTRKFKKLPPFLTERKSCNLFYCGLGFDKHTDDYKVVVFYTGYGMLESIIKVYRLRTNKWTSVNLKGREFVGGMVFANGKLLGVSMSELEREFPFWAEQEIVSFDMETEEYGRVLEVPNYVDSVDHRLRLCVCEGCIYSLAHSYNNAADVWIIGGYELGKEAWTKLATIPLKNTVFPCTLVNVKRNGEILLRVGFKFMVFNTNDCTLKDLDVTLPGDLYYMLTYVESLVSPFV